MIKSRQPNNNKRESTEKSVDSPVLLPIVEKKTYRDETIEVLNILEQHGTNIYDNKRYGGMYLNKKDKITEFFDKKDEPSIDKHQLNNFFKQ